MSISYPQFKKALEPFLCFSLQDVRKHFPRFDRKRLTEWRDKGFLEKVIRGYYIFKDVPKDIQFWWYIGNCIYEPSYISLQSALNYYGFIPEAVFQVTSLTTKRTRSLDSSQISFSYRNIKNSCYFGYILIRLREHNYIRLAEPEKALLDFLYLEVFIENEEDFEAVRFNKKLILQTVDMSLMEQYALLMQNKSFYKRFSQFKNWLHA